MDPRDFEQGSCPACGVSWQGKEIPNKYRDSHGSIYYSRVTGIEYGIDVPQKYWYDGMSEYHCPDCKARFNRWTLEQLKDGELVLPYGRKETDE